MSRVLLSIVVGVIGCVLTYPVATITVAVSEVVIGRMLSTILGIIVGLGGLAITIAVAFTVAKTDKKA